MSILSNGSRSGSSGQSDGPACSAVTGSAEGVGPVTSDAGIVRGDALWLCECPVCPCDNARRLMGRVKGALVCPQCLLAHKFETDDLGDPYQLEERTRERMLARGGTHRHLVLKGLT